MPKLHKSPYSHRFIAASSACTTKPLSKLLALCLKLLRHYKELASVPGLPVTPFYLRALIVRGRDTLKTGKAWDDTSREDRRKMT